MAQLPLVENDSWLKPFEAVISHRFEKANRRAARFVDGKKSLADAANGHLFFGLHAERNAWVLREWAPHATSLYLIGDFSNWAPQEAFKFQKIGGGNWECRLPGTVLEHGMLYKLLIGWDGGSHERLPAYCRRVVQDEHTKIFSAQVWCPEQEYVWKNPSLPKVKNPLIYEAHIGMATQEFKVGTYTGFTENVLPRIARLGYNTIQLMAIQEHPYYGSFGYQVSNFFAPSSRFGTPEELKLLIDTAHGYGMAVILDIVHSHAVKNEAEGLSRFDGTDYQYFHGGSRGDHPVWDSRCFDYGKDEVIHFLLSNCKYWLEEFHFDGFRFDGVTSMLYLHHGLGIDFTSYDMYYNGEQDEDAIVYLTLANQLIHQVNPQAVTIAEDVSGMPGMASPVYDGGLDFDFRMSMGVADFWIKIIKEQKDEDWHVGDMYYQLTNKRSDEQTISYAESHDQAMVGDKTIIFRLIDDRMYTAMQVSDVDVKVDRGIALHKMIRLLTLATAGGGYLNFMGNEFGHPEWIDFPREGNQWSFHYARRQWDLVDNKKLRYHYLNQFDAAMIHLVKTQNILAHQPYSIKQHIPDQVLVFKRGGLLFVFNFNPLTSFSDYSFEVEQGTYQIVLNSDAIDFNGFGRNDDSLQHISQEEQGQHSLKLYLPSRSSMVLKKD